MSSIPGRVIFPVPININHQEYLEDIFSRILDHPGDRLDELLPDQWKKARDEEAAAAQAPQSK